MKVKYWHVGFPNKTFSKIIIRKNISIRLPCNVKSLNKLKFREYTKENVSSVQVSHFR